MVSPFRSPLNGHQPERASRQFTNALKDRSPQRQREPESGVMLQHVEKRCERRDEPAFPGGDEDAEQTHAPKSQGTGGGAACPFVHQDEFRSTLNGQAEGRHFAPVEPLGIRQCRRHRDRRYHLNKRRKNETPKSGVGYGEAVEFCHDFRRGDNRTEQRNQDRLLSQEAQVQDDRGVRDNRHREPRERRVSRSSASVSSS